VLPFPDLPALQNYKEEVEGWLETLEHREQICYQFQFLLHAQESRAVQCRSMDPKLLNANLREQASRYMRGKNIVQLMNVNTGQ